MPKILIFGDDTRSFLTTVRSLGRKGYGVNVVPSDWSSPALKSRYIAAAHRLPPYQLSPKDWVLACRNLIEAGGYDLIIPCNETAILPLKTHQEELGNPPLAIVNDAAFDVLFDKHLTRLKAADVGIPVAGGKVLEETDTAETLIQSIGLPLALKPRLSYHLDRLHHRGAVQLIATKQDLQHALSAIKNREDFIVEGFFKGVGVGLSVLAKEGRVLQAFQHRRVREPKRGGGSSYRKSEPPTSKLLAATKALCNAVSLTGLSMFEFRENAATGDFILLEVNARLWGSVPLPVAAGLDFPFLMAELMIAGKEHAPAHYKTPVYARNLHNDLDDIFNELVAYGLKALPSTASRLFGYARWLVGLEASDTKASDDKDVHKADIAAFRTDLCERIRRKVGPWRREDAHKTRAELAALLKAPGAKSLCFLCFGNICRSPFAEMLAKRVLSGLDGAADLDIFSTGTLPLKDRHTPEYGQEAAKEFGIDLSNHRSSHITNHPPERYNIILHFDPRMEKDWHRIGWAPNAKLFNMAALIDPMGDTSVIADPYGHDKAIYQSRYRDIEAAVDWIRATLI